MTAIGDLKFLGERNDKKYSGTALVCGGSISGLLAARVLSDYFEKVLIVEPEEWLTTKDGISPYSRDESGQLRKHSKVFQYRFTHVYQGFVSRTLVKMFPNFRSEIEEFGGRLVNGPLNIYMNGYPMANPSWRAKNEDLVFVTRPILETAIRRLTLQACSNVKYLCGTVTSLLRASKTGPVDGVQIRLPNGQESTILAALVIDCTGGSYSGLRWLRELETKTSIGQNLERLKTSYNFNFVYGCFELDIPDKVILQLKKLLASAWNKSMDQIDLQAIYHAWGPESDYGRELFGIFRQEGNLFHLACGGFGIEACPKTIKQLRERCLELNFAQLIPEWIIDFLDIIEREELPFAYTTNRMLSYKMNLAPAVYIDYFKAKGLPSNFIVMGDAIHRANPVRGQGVVKACMDAVSLGGLLASQRHESGLLDDFAEQFFAIQAKRSGALWDSGKLIDYGWDSTVPCTGEDLSLGSFQRVFSKHLRQLTLTDPHAENVLLNVAQYCEPPTLLFAPSILFGCFWIWAKEKVGYNN
ncbi:hypothetical protein M422DRAFT_50721 [Sphaerobolus stellatus SS14]|uniref:FAD-binding domain-containing protein n=1 Tax=Sphaerobolus stellatus (strain SS14) TaxID=990650 RepID=A0A0C9U2N3_SPHS4|nr:hypothetical protein M422DRAFT_50721 [Sphaerobolus stellatus SS14]